MMNYKKSIALIVFAAFIFIGFAATSPPGKRHFKNLKVLPKRISKDSLDEVMNNFRSALGVDCNFCHAPSTDSASHEPDYASDAKPEKDIARKMMRMTSKINKKYFNDAKNEKFKTLPAVSCITCHHRKAQAGERH